jgi:hypothetical protein
MHLVLAAGPQPYQLDPVPGQFPELADLTRGDPRFGQPAHPQQIGKVLSVFLVILYPPVAERLHSQRMRQVHLRTGGLQGISRPVPPIRCLQHHLRRQTGLDDLRYELARGVADPGRCQLPAIRGHPHQHRTPPVQIHTHDLRAVIR